MSLFSPLRNTARGWHSFVRGISWLKAHPLYLLLLFVPITLGLGLLLLGGGYFWQYQDDVFQWLMFAKPESWWGITGYYVVKGLLYAVIFVLGLIFYALFINVVSSPIYDYVSMAVERDLIQGPPPEISLWETIKLMGEEIKKAIFIMLLSLAFLFIPFLSPIAPIVAAFCVGWDLYDFPLARRGWTFRKRLNFVVTHVWSVFGLGLWLLIPGMQLILMPLAVVGGTILAVEDIQTVEHSLKGKKG